MIKKFKFEPRKLKIGMRTFKSGLSVFIVILLFSAFGVSDGIQIAALAAVFSLREDFDKSVDFGATRIFSNSIGGLYALLYFILQDWIGQSFWLTLLLVPMFAMLTIMTNVAFNNPAGVISGVATMLIIALSVPAGHSIIYALTRVFQTFIGVFVAIVVNADIKRIHAWRKNQIKNE